MALIFFALSCQVCLWTIDAADAFCGTSYLTCVDLHTTTSIQAASNNCDNQTGILAYRLNALTEMYF